MSTQMYEIHTFAKECLNKSAARPPVTTAYGNGLPDSHDSDQCIIQQGSDLRMWSDINIDYASNSSTDEKTFGKQIIISYLRYHNTNYTHLPKR